MEICLPRKKKKYSNNKTSSKKGLSFVKLTKNMHFQAQRVENKTFGKVYQTPCSHFSLRSNELSVGLPFSTYICVLCFSSILWPVAETPTKRSQRFPLASFILFCLLNENKISKRFLEDNRMLLFISKIMLWFLCVWFLSLRAFSWKEESETTWNC